MSFGTGHFGYVHNVTKGVVSLSPFWRKLPCFAPAFPFVPNLGCET